MIVEINCVLGLFTYFSRFKEALWVETPAPGEATPAP